MVMEMGRIIFCKIMDAASGVRVKSARFDFGETEFVPWAIGAVM